MKQARWVWTRLPHRPRVALTLTALTLSLFVVGAILGSTSFGMWLSLATIAAFLTTVVYSIRALVLWRPFRAKPLALPGPLDDPVIYGRKALAASGLADTVGLTTQQMTRDGMQRIAAGFWVGDNTRRGFEAWVTLPTGMSVDDLERAYPRLAVALYSEGVITREVRGSRVRIEVIYRAAIQGPPSPSRSPLHATFLGLNVETGEGVYEDLRLHTAVAGRSGMGKTTFMKSLVGSAMTDPGTVVLFADAKGGMEAALFERGLAPEATSRNLETTVTLLERVVRLMEARQADCPRLYGKSTVTEAPPYRHRDGWPHIVVVFDEAAAILGPQAAEMDRKLHARATTAAKLLAQQGRSAGITLVVALQDPLAENFGGIRGQLGNRIAFAITDASHIHAFLGDLPNGTDAWPSPKALGKTPGRAIVQTADGYTEIAAPYWTDDDTTRAVEDAHHLNTISPWIEWEHLLEAETATEEEPAHD